MNDHNIYEYTLHKCSLSAQDIHISGTGAHVVHLTPFCVCGKSEDGDIRAEDAEKAFRIDERYVCMHVNACSHT
jgi:hypothetical protein